MNQNHAVGPRVRPPLVVNVGVLGDLPGGMAQVVNQYLEMDFSSIEVRGLRSTKGKGDKLWPARWLRCATALASLRLRRRDVAVAVHLSAKGSFVREGSLAALARSLGFGVTLHMHGSEFPAFASVQPGLVKKVCGYSDLILVLTDETADIISSLFGEGESLPHIEKIVNAVQIPSEIPEKEDALIFAGEVGPRKGVDVLLKAWEILGSETAGWKLKIAGPAVKGFDVQELRERVEFLGTVSHQECTRLQLESKVAVLPSRHEALPMFLIESMAAGCAVVGTDVGQVDSLIAGTKNSMVPAGNAVSLAAAIRAFLTDPELTRSAGQEGRQLAIERYSSSRLTSILEQNWLSTMGRSA